MAGHDHGGTSGRGRPQRGIEVVTAGGIEASVGLVEQPQFGAASDQARQRCAPALSGTQLADGDIGEPISQPHARHRRLHLVGRSAHRGAPEAHVVGNREIGVETIRVTKQPNTRSHGDAIAHEVDTKHGRRTTFNGEQSGAQPQQRSLARAVWAAQQNDLAALNGQRRTSQRRKATQHSDYIDEFDHSFHLNGDASGRLPGRPAPRQIASKAVTSGMGYSFSPLARFRRYRQQRVPYFSRPKPPHDWHWVVAGIGKTLIWLGLLMFGFVGYQLWGTGIQTAQAQDRLEDEFREKLEAGSTTTTTTNTSTTIVVTDTTTVPGETTTLPPTTPTTIPRAAASDPIPNGEAIAILRIPRLDLEWQVVEGVKVADLKKGPGHFRETVMPGQLGNSAIAGHRTTYGQPFRNIDQLEVGDLIEVTTLVGNYTYAVTDSIIVNPSDYALVIPTIDPTVATLALVTCDPAFTARNRLTVRATLVPGSSSQVFAPPPSTLAPTTEATTGETTATDATTPTETTAVGAVATTVTAEPEVDLVDEGDEEDAFSEGWFSEPDAIPHAIGWGLLLLAVGIGAKAAGRAANRLYVSFLVGAVPFLVVLYFFFENVNRLLPPSL